MLRIVVNNAAPALARVVLKFVALAAAPLRVAVMREIVVVVARAVHQTPSVRAVSVGSLRLCSL